MSLEKPVVFKSCGEQVVGMLHLPARRKGKWPAVVCFHGFTGNKQESHRLFVKMGRMLAASGVVCLRIDFRGSGDSEGDFSQMTPTGEVADAHEALAYLRKLPGVDLKRIGVLGMSMGGMVSAFVLGKDKAIKTSVLWAPVGNPKRLVEGRMTPQAREQLDTMGLIDNEGWAVGKDFIGEMMVINPLKAIAKVRGPVLIVHGDNDQSVPLAESCAYVEALLKAGRKVEYRVIQGSDHVFSSMGWETEVLALTFEWFRMLL